jgi:hypothetical protein
MIMKKNAHVRPALTAVAAAGLLGLAALAVAGAPADASSPSGITVYQVKNVDENVALGSQSDPTSLAVKSVPAGKYLVTGEIGVDTQPGSFIVCAVSNTTLGNDGVFGEFTNQTADGAMENVTVTEVVTVSKKQSIHLTCDDNNGNSGDVVHSAVVEATPVSSLR